MTKSNIFFTVSTGLSVRNFFSSPVQNDLSLLSRDFNLIIITTPHLRHCFPKHLTVFPALHFKQNLLSRLFHFLMRVAFDSLYTTTTKSIIRKQPLVPSLKTSVTSFFVSIHPRSFTLYSFYRHLFSSSVHFLTSSIRSSYLNFNPKLVVSLNPLNFDEQLFTFTFSSITPTIGVVKSFDNISSDGFIPFLPDILCVWDTRMAVDSLNAYQISFPRVQIIGSPQFDDISVNFPFDNSHCLSPPVKILYCTNSPNIYPGDPIIASMLSDFAVTHNFQITIRLHQADNLARWHQFTNLPNVSLYAPHDVHHSPHTISASPQHLASLRHQISESCLVICSYSTIFYDSLSLNTPCINLGFDPEGIDAKYPITRADSFCHLEPFLTSPFVHTARNFSELFSLVSYYSTNSHSSSYSLQLQNFLRCLLPTNFNDSCISKLSNIISSTIYDDMSSNNVSSS